MAFGEKLRQLREDRGLTQVQLSKLCGVSKNTIEFYELNERIPTKNEVIQNIINAFDVSFNYLFTKEQAFEIEATQKYGSVGRKQALKLIESFKDNMD